MKVCRNCGLPDGEWPSGTRSICDYNQVPGDLCEYVVGPYTGGLTASLPPVPHYPFTLRQSELLTDLDDECYEIRQSMPWRLRRLEIKLTIAETLNVPCGLLFGLGWLLGQWLASLL